MNERLENRGRLQELELSAKRLRLSIQGLVHTIRTETNPFNDPTEMDEELIHEQAFELSQKIGELKGIENKAAAVKKALGIE